MRLYARSGKNGFDSERAKRSPLRWYPYRKAESKGYHLNSDDKNKSIFGTIPAYHPIFIRFSNHTLINYEERDQHG